MSIYWIDYVKLYVVGGKNVEEMLKIGINNKIVKLVIYSWVVLEYYMYNESGLGL